MDNIKDLVDNGVHLLDEKIPNWREQIDLTTLDLADFDLCVLGQLAHHADLEPFKYGYYNAGLLMLGINETEAKRYGFDIGIHDSRAWATLNEEWQVRAEGHVDYPHEPGRLYDCPGCEWRCHCDDDPGTTACVWQMDSHNAAGDRYGKHHAAMLEDQEDRS